MPGYIAIPMGFFYLTMDRLILILLLLYWIFGLLFLKLVRNTLMRSLKANKAITYLIICFLFLNLIAVYNSLDFETSLKRYINFLLYVISSYFVVLSIPLQKNHLKKIGFTFLFSSIILIAISILEIINKENVFTYFLHNTNLTEYQEADLLSKMRSDTRRIQASFANPLTYGQFIIMIIPILLFFRKIISKKKWIWYVTILSLGALTFMIKSRAATLILFLIILYGLYYFFFITKIKFSSKILVFLLCFLLGLVVFDLINHSIVADFFGGESLMSDDNRLQQFILAGPLISENIWSGYGFGMGAEVLDYGSLGRANGTIDNYFLTIILDSGILTLITFIILCITIFSKYFKIKKHNKFLLVGLIFFIVNLLSLSVTEIHPIFYFFLALLLKLDHKLKIYYGYNPS